MARAARKSKKTARSPPRLSLALPVRRACHWRKIVRHFAGVLRTDEFPVNLGRPSGTGGTPLDRRGRPHVAGGAGRCYIYQFATNCVPMARKIEASRKLQKRAEQMIPGGVNSPVRAFAAVGGDPLFIVRGQGSHLWDADGNEYIDYVGSWGPLILGHAAPEWWKRSPPPPERHEFRRLHPRRSRSGRDLVSAFPHMQKVRFVSSGTEATMSAIRLARAHTKRKYIVKFEGCYHGHADALLVKAGSGVATLGIPGSAGVPEEFTQFTIALPFNDTMRWNGLSRSSATRLLA